MYNLGTYIPGTSPVHRLDPRLKIIAVVVLSVLILRADALPGALLTLFVASLVPLSGAGIPHMLGALKPVRFFLLMLFLLHLLFTDGTPVPPFPPWRVTVTWEGLTRGAFVTWQFALLVLSASILTATTTPTELVTGMERLLRPLARIGVPSHDLATMVSLAMRFVPTLLGEMDRIKEAQASRGASLTSGGIAGRTRTAVSLAIPVIMGSFRRADHLAVAMEARAFTRGPRTYLRALRMEKPDYLAAGVMVLLMICCVAA